MEVRHGACRRSRDRAVAPTTRIAGSFSKIASIKPGRRWTLAGEPGSQLRLAELGARLVYVGSAVEVAAAAELFAGELAAAAAPAGGPHLLLGCDQESVPTTKAGQSGQQPVALLQLSTAAHAFIFDLHMIY